MKIYIFADMEGISGITGSSFVTSDGTHLQEGRRYFTADINTCAQACFDAGADEVIVRDGHARGISLLWDQLIPGVKVVQGTVPHRRFFNIEGSDGMILLGYHAMAGTQRAHLEHTYTSKEIQNIWLNGKKAGEFAIDTAIAGEYNVPVIMTSGCDKLCAEAKSFLPEVVTCQVKTSISQQGAMLLASADAHRLIQEKTMEAIAMLKAGKFHPVKLSPATVRIEYMERMEPMRGLFSDLCDDRTVEATAATVEEAFFRLRG